VPPLFSTAYRLCCAIEKLAVASSLPKGTAAATGGTGSAG